jgi:hypothetical protein
LLADVAKSEGRDYSDYVDSATLTGDWILNHMLDDNNLVLNIIGTNNTVACNFDRTYYSRNTGNLIEAFAVLADVTGDAKWQTAYERTIYGATQKATWNGNDGVVTEGTDSTDVDVRAMKGGSVLFVCLFALFTNGQAVMLRATISRGTVPRTPSSSPILMRIWTCRYVQLTGKGCSDDLPIVVDERNDRSRLCQWIKLLFLQLARPFNVHVYRRWYDRRR